MLIHTKGNSHTKLHTGSGQPTGRSLPASTLLGARIHMLFHFIPFFLGLNIQPEKSHRRLHIHHRHHQYSSAIRVASAICGPVPGAVQSQRGQAEGAAGQARAEPVAAGSREWWAGNTVSSSRQLGQKSAVLERLSASGPTSRVKNRAVRREKSKREREKTP